MQEKHEMKIRSRESGLTQVVSDHNIKSVMASHFMDSDLPSKILNETQVKKKNRISLKKIFLINFMIFLKILFLKQNFFLINKFCGFFCIRRLKL